MVTSPTNVSSTSEYQVSDLHFFSSLFNYDVLRPTFAELKFTRICLLIKRFTFVLKLATIKNFDIYKLINIVIVS